MSQIGSLIYGIILLSLCILDKLYCQIQFTLIYDYKGTEFTTQEN